MNDVKRYGNLFLVGISHFMTFTFECCIVLHIYLNDSL
jgi:hypothetical protein